MTDVQVQAFGSAVLTAEVQSERAKPKLVASLIQAGYTQPHIDRLFAYVRSEAPMHVRFPSALLVKFCEDTHYRSQFETGSSRGSTDMSSRKTWERRLMGDQYEDEAKPFERVKYGSLCLAWGSIGASMLEQYGDAVLLLKDHMRVRMTFTEKDSCYTKLNPGTSQHCAHILAGLSHDDLCLAMDVANRLRVPTTLGDAHMPTHYVECQFHGPLRFDKDVEALLLPENSTPGKDPELWADAKRFGERHGIPVRTATPHPAIALKRA